MQRNKLIYALADAALAVSSDYGKGGTWTGAVEQLDKLRFVPVYVRANGEAGQGLEGLRERGAMPWPNPKTPEAFEGILNALPSVECSAPEQRALSPGIREESAPFESDRQTESTTPVAIPESHVVADSSPADELFTKVKELLERMDGPRTETRASEELQVSKKQAEVWLKRFVEEKLGEWFERTDVPRTEAEIAEELRLPRNHIRRCLKRLIDEDMIEKLSRPVRYRSTASIGPLFDRRG